MLTTRSFVIAFLITLLFITGCTQSTLNTNWGSSFEESRVNQIANPGASENLDPVVDLDGEMAERSMESYRQGSDGKKKSTTYNLRLGGIEGIGAK
jgi:hypothetical protein